MEHALPESGTEGSAPPARALARRAAAFARVLETFAVSRCTRIARDSRVNPLTRWSGWSAGVYLEGTGNQYWRAVASSLLKVRNGVFRLRRRFGFHRSIHSTNAGGTSLRTIITRRMRSSRSIVAVPTRAASTVG